MLTILINNDSPTYAYLKDIIGHVFDLELRDLTQQIHGAVRDLHRVSVAVTDR